MLLINSAKAVAQVTRDALVPQIPDNSFLFPSMFTCMICALTGQTRGEACLQLGSNSGMLGILLTREWGRYTVERAGIRLLRISV